MDSPTVSSERRAGLLDYHGMEAIPTGVALVHDYLTQRGGAERVVLTLARAFPGAPLYTSFYDPDATFPEFAELDVRTLPLNRVAPLRRRHRAALPLLAPSFSRLRVEADVLFCSSSGWAHASRARGRKVVYCHTSARWLYQTSRYLAESGVVARTGLALARRPLERWDRKAALSADRYLANSTWVAREIERIYGVDAEILYPPVMIEPAGPQEAVSGIDPGYVLCVARLLPYKNLGAIVSAFDRLPSERLVVVGRGPDEARLHMLAGPNVRFAGTVADAELRWLYANARGLVTAAYEDFGLTPLEAAAFGKPVAALRFGGYLDTVREGETGLFFDLPDPRRIAAAAQQLLDESWSAGDLREHAAAFSEQRFVERIREIAREELELR
jgi:glycosyltransferase involved in cell wall biosynthesis